MPLTADDVRNKRFTTVRLREGYDMAEVDQFLDEVEAELRRVTGENDELRSRLHAATGEPVPASVTAAPTAGPAVDTVALERDSVSDEEARDEVIDTDAAGDQPETAPVTTLATAPSAAGPSAPAAAAPPERMEVTTTQEASAAATRLLELAGQSADQLVTEAERKSEEILGAARGQAEALESETEERRRTLVADIEAEKARLEAEIDSLRTFEREYRSELRTYFEEQLAALDGQGAGGVLGRTDTAGGSPSGSDADAGENTGGGSDQGPSPLQSILKDDER